MAEKKQEEKSNVCRGDLVIYSKTIKCSTYGFDDKHYIAIKIGYGKGYIMAYYLLDEQDGITDVVFDLRNVHKKYIGKKGINYRDFVFQLNPLVSESFVLEGFVDGYDDKILTLACVVAGTNLHFYRPHAPWGYHTRMMLEALDKYFNQHLALDRYKNSDIVRKLIDSLKKPQLALTIVSLMFFAGAITMIVLGIVNVIPLWLGLLIGIPVTLVGGLMGIGNLIAYLTDVIGKHFKNNELYSHEYYHLATYSRLR